jgi:uncharacterized RDD family membrane protein YckC
MTTKGIGFETISVPPALRPCGLLRRLMIMVYDLVIIMALLMLAAALALLAQSGDKTAFRDPGYTAYLLAVWYLYLAWCWRRGGMTLGMRAWRVRIIDNNGNRPGWAQCTLRFLCSVLSAAALGSGFIWSLFDREKRCWHDIASGTRLLRT